MLINPVFSASFSNGLENDGSSNAAPLVKSLIDFGDLSSFDLMTVVFTEEDVKLASAIGVFSSMCLTISVFNNLCRLLL